MPYIKQDIRNNLDEDISCLFSALVMNSSKESIYGNLNYSFTNILETAIELNGKNYSTINSLVGMLECCKMELYRRMAGPYEILKAYENGDVDIYQENI